MANEVTLITGGAGFIGCNYAARCIAKGEKIRIFDNLSRKGAERNLAWLNDLYGNGSYDLVVGDVREASQIEKAATDATRILHLAAQVAVTTSVTDPHTDFQINALGTFNTLEAARRSGRKPFFFTLPPTRFMAAWKTCASSKNQHATIMPISLMEPLKNNCLISIHRMDALKAVATSMFAITHAFMTFPRLCSANRVFTDAGNSALKTRAGWPGSSSQH
jgi:UDP-glucose 4-epimerase